MITVIPSIASADPLRIHDEMARVASIKKLHLDIEDGNFINNITFGRKTVAAIANVWRGEVDAHLMVMTPLEYVDWLAESGVASVCAHLEALPYPKLFLARCREQGMRAGLAVNLKIHPGEVASYAEDLDYLLVMTSEPDGREQSFFPDAAERVAAFRALTPPQAEIWCDGGITPAHLPKLYAAGMDVAIMGRAVFSADNPVDAVRTYEISVM